MFVRSLMDKDVVYRKGGYDWVIKAGTVTFIDENKVTARELKGLYGSRVIIVSRDATEDKVAVKIINSSKNTPFQKTEVPELNETLIDDIISQIEEEELEIKKKKEAEEKLKKEQEEKARKEAEEKLKKELEEKARKELEAKLKKEQEEKAKKVTKEPTKSVSKATSKRRGRRKKQA